MSHDSAESMSPAKRALYELRTLRGRVEQLERAANEAVAVVGLGLRFPGGAVDPDSFWRLLVDGVDAVTPIPASRWDLERFHADDPETPGTMYTRYGAFLEDVDRFDAPFFGISPREAASLDPQHRILLEVVWEALENAGQNPQALEGSATGVFVAMSNSDYGRMVFSDPLAVDVYSSTGTNFSAAAGRVSFFLGLTGPSVVVDAACSGSLVGVHLASQSLRAGECSMAIAGGVNLILSPEININFSKARMMAPDGRCKTFDDDADGYVRGEGCGVVVLRRLSDALADGNRILAVIRGSAVNQDGRSAGLTVPNGPAQEAVLQAALAKAGVAGADIDYIEAHGTGTALGDPIEARAIRAVLGVNRPGDRPLRVGSVKTNVGHLESAAGVAGLIKVVLALQHEQIPPHLNFTKLNSHIDWNGFPVEIPVSARPWTRGRRRRLAGVSSFGFSGTNAHVIVEEGPQAAAADPVDAVRPVLALTMSSAHESGLPAMAARLLSHLERHPDLDLADVCASANSGRAALAHRAVYVASSAAALRAALGEARPAVAGRAQGATDVAFVFTGQGAQYAGMGRQLYVAEPVFRAAIDECAELLVPHLDIPLTALLWGDATGRLEGDTSYTQPALFALQWALAQLWRSWGVRPSVVLGHSVGEYAAACVAGVYSLADGVRLIAARGRLSGGLPRDEGAMSVLLAPRARVEAAVALASSAVAVAAFNGPDCLTISGSLPAVEAIEAGIAADGYRVERLRVSHAFHSPLVESVADAFEAEAAALTMRAPSIAVISTVTGGLVCEELTEPRYWRRQLRDSVYFEEALATLAAQGCGAFIEIGPGSTLLGLGQPLIERPGQVWTPSIRRSRNDSEQMAESLASLWTRGVTVDWAAYEAAQGRRARVALPTYPFDRQRYWIEQAADGTSLPHDVFWAGIEEAGGRQAGQARLDLDVASYPRRWECLERLTHAFIMRTLVDLRVFTRSGERHSLDSFMSAAGIAGGYRKLMERWLVLLSERGVLSAGAGIYECVRPIEDPDVAGLTAEADVIFAADRILLDFVLRCGRQLPAILTGQVSSLETLFPNGDFALAEALYEHAPLSAYFAGIARAVLEAIVRGRGAKPIRVLEIGAGTGATTSSLLPVLPPGSTYLFTDVSDIFLHHARSKFASWPAVQFGRLDIETGESDRAMRDGGFDVVVATNAIHAVRNLDVALQHVRRLMAPGASLILCEATSHLSWFDITTGLIEGWQRFEDAWRIDQPLLTPDRWALALAAAGMDRIVSWPRDESPASVLGQHVIAAGIPGLWRGRSALAAQTGNMETAVLPAESTPASARLEALRELSADDRRTALVDILRVEMAAVLRVTSADTIDPARKLMELGVDSLMALEFRRRVSDAFALSRALPATLVYDHPTLEHLAAYLAETVLKLDEAVAEVDPPIAEPDRVLAIDTLTDDEAEALLLSRLHSWQVSS